MEKQTLNISIYFWKNGGETLKTPLRLSGGPSKSPWDSLGGVQGGPPGPSGAPPGPSPVQKEIKYILICTYLCTPHNGGLPSPAPVWRPGVMAASSAGPRGLWGAYTGALTGEAPKWSGVRGVLQAKTKITNPRIRARIGPAPKIALGK